MRTIISAALVSVALLASTAAQAATVALENGNFNAGWSQADGDFRPGHAGGNPDGWGASGGSSTGHWNPTVTSFTNEAAHGGVGWAHATAYPTERTPACWPRRLAATRSRPIPATP